jgi:hypothetical protein
MRHFPGSVSSGIFLGVAVCAGAACVTFVSAEDPSSPSSAPSDAASDAAVATGADAGGSVDSEGG